MKLLTNLRHLHYLREKKSPQQKRVVSLADYADGADCVEKRHFTNLGQIMNINVLNLSGSTQTGEEPPSKTLTTIHLSARAMQVIET